MLAQDLDSLLCEASCVGRRQSDILQTTQRIDPQDKSSLVEHFTFAFIHPRYRKLTCKPHIRRFAPRRLLANNLSSSLDPGTSKL